MTDPTPNDLIEYDDGDLDPADVAEWDRRVTDALTGETETIPHDEVARRHASTEEEA